MSSTLAKYHETTNKVGARSCSIGTLIGLALPISMIVMGALYLDDCPAQRYIPIYLIVSGAFSVTLALLRVLGNFLADNEGKKPVFIETISGIISMFLFAWFIAGNVWIYGLYNKYSREPSDANFCNHTFYLYAFWVTTVTYILMGISFLIFCCACLCGMCSRKE